MVYFAPHFFIQSFQPFSLFELFLFRFQRLPVQIVKDRCSKSESAISSDTSSEPSPEFELCEVLDSLMMLSLQYAFAYSTMFSQTLAPCSSAALIKHSSQTSHKKGFVPVTSLPEDNHTTTWNFMCLKTHFQVAVECIPDTLVVDMFSIKAEVVGCLDWIERKV
ncbi:hypothetical protein PAXRUDRAFT_17525 [Paxillus rubicundulus Ve08.2h10]|uniref:Unplaced genomic scaffold scaffold_2183, whole genome shotgun sequence n=1 Tax=Paxillus rubicundulus Ve08.2h10 TaxID=930991 RepID=A0A0D0DHB6_9AGAM|nr:hypothetical protein PAXRUDRAFT_17525 [Paxillus rubicundulus Ve08.2h10]